MACQSVGTISYPNVRESRSFVFAQGHIRIILRQIYGTLISSTTSGLSGPGSNDNERVLYSPPMSRTIVSTSEAVERRIVCKLSLADRVN